MDQDEIYARQLQAEFEASEREANERDERIALELQNQFNQENENIHVTLPPQPPTRAETQPSQALYLNETGSDGGIGNQNQINSNSNLNSGSGTVNLSAGSAALIRIHHVKTGNFIKEIFKLHTLSNNLVIFEIESELESDTMPIEGPKRLIVTDDGRVTFGYDHTDRSKFKVEVIESGNGSSGVYLKSWAHRRNRNMWGSTGWYLAMSPEGVLLGDSGKVPDSLWTLMTASASLGVDIPRDLVIDPEADRGLGLVTGYSSRNRMIFQLPASAPAPVPGLVPVPGPSMPLNPGHKNQNQNQYTCTNPILVFLATPDGIQFLRNNQILMDMYTSNDTTATTNTAVNPLSTHNIDNRFILMGYREALECYTHYRPEGWESAAVQYYRYTQRDLTYFPRPRPSAQRIHNNNTSNSGNGSGSGSGNGSGEGTTASSVYQSLFGTSSTVGKSTSTTSNGYEMVDTVDAGGVDVEVDTSVGAGSGVEEVSPLFSEHEHAPTHTTGVITTSNYGVTTLFQLEYKKYYLSAVQVKEYIDNGYILLSQAACTQIIPIKPNSNPNSDHIDTRVCNSHTVQSDILIKNATRLINYFNGHRMNRGSVYKPNSNSNNSGSSSGSDIGGLDETNNTKYYSSLCCDPEILTLYYDTVLYPITYQLLASTCIKPKRIDETNRIHNNSNSNNMTNTMSSGMEIEMKDIGTGTNPMNPHPNTSIYSNSQSEQTVQYIDHVYISSKAPVLSNNNCDISGIGNSEQLNKNEQLISDWTEVGANGSGIGIGSQYTTLPIPVDEPHHHAHSHRAIPRCRQTDTAHSKPHGCRVVIALSDTDKRVGTDRAHNSNGNMAIYARSHSGQKEIELRQFHLKPGDVLICHQDVFCKELPNYNDTDIKLWVNMHVFHQKYTD